jgi:hypothetical protein
MAICSNVSLIFSALLVKQSWLAKCTISTLGFQLPERSILVLSSERSAMFRRLTQS